MKLPPVSLAAYIVAASFLVATATAMYLPQASSSSSGAKQQQLTAAAAASSATGGGNDEAAAIRSPYRHPFAVQYKMPFVGHGRRGYDDFVSDELEGAVASAEGEGAQREAVYDPGDDLLRAFTAELNTAAANEEAADYPDALDSSKYEVLGELQRDLLEDQEIIRKTAVLVKLLQDPSIDTLPVVYVEEADPSTLDEAEAAEAASALDGTEDGSDALYGGGPRGISKRGRYYRRYTWKRHNRNRYEPELRYACTPSKEDVFRLLRNLHENRMGKNKTVHICNRKRPAKAVFTNIRFLG